MDTLSFSPFLQGAITGLGLIAAIGSQNAFVIKQGLLKNRVFLVSSICFLSDVFLLCLGIFGVGELIVKSPLIMKIFQIGGVSMLGWYSLSSLYSCYKGSSSLAVEASKQRLGLKPLVLMTLAFTFLNPHVYLDTVVIMGGIATHLNESQKPLFMLGSMTGSFLWFFGIGLGAAKASVLLKSSKTWRIIDGTIGILMALFAFKLATQF